MPTQNQRCHRHCMPRPPHLNLTCFMNSYFGARTVLRFMRPKLPSQRPLKYKRNRAKPHKTCFTNHLRSLRRPSRNWMRLQQRREGTNTQRWARNRKNTILLLLAHPVPILSFERKSNWRPGDGVLVEHFLIGSKYCSLKGNYRIFYQD